jgi:hypothetical protein
MPRYEPDDYAQEHPADDAVNANCVASWRARADADGAEGLLVDLHNGWYFDSRHWTGRGDVPGLILRALQRNERGRRGIGRNAQGR